MKLHISKVKSGIGARRDAWASSHYRLASASHIQKRGLMNALLFLDYNIFYPIRGQLTGWYISQGSGQETETTQDILIRN